VVRMKRSGNYSLQTNKDKNTAKKNKETLHFLCVPSERKAKPAKGSKHSN